MSEYKWQITSVSVLVLVWFVLVHGSLASKRVRWPKTKTATPKKSVLNRNETQVQLKEAVNIESVAVAINAKTFQKVKSNTADAQTPWWGADDLHQVLKWWWYIIPVHDICDWTPGGQQGSLQAVLKVTSSHKIIMLGPMLRINVTAWSTWGWRRFLQFLYFYIYWLQSTRTFSHFQFGH